MPKQPFVPVDRVVRIRFAGLHQATPWVNGLAIQYTGLQPDTTAMATFATALRQAWASAFSTMLTSLCSLNETQVWDISSDAAASAIDTTDVLCTGINTNPLPVQSAVCVTWPVQSRYRGGHFRTYFVGRTLSDINNGRLLTSTARTAYGDAAAAFRTAVNGLTLSGSLVTLGGVRYYPTGFNPDGTPITKTSGQFFPFGIPTVRTRLDSQRRRAGKEIS